MTKDFSVIYYLKREHMGRFEEAGEGTFMGEPSRQFLGAVGSSLIKWRRKNGKSYFELDYLQAHFATKPFSNMKDANYILRSLATKYGGCRVKVLDFIFKVAKKEGFEIIYSDYNHNIGT